MLQVSAAAAAPLNCECFFLNIHYRGGQRDEMYTLIGVVVLG